MAQEVEDIFHPDGRWFNPWSPKSACQRILGQHTVLNSSALNHGVYLDSM